MTSGYVDHTNDAEDADGTGGSVGMSELGCCFLQVGKELFVDADQMARLLEANELERFEKAHESNPHFVDVVEEDHVFNPKMLLLRSSGEKKKKEQHVTVVLNAALGSACLNRLHPLLSKQKNWIYAWRPVLTHKCIQSSRQERGGDGGLDSCAALGSKDPVKVAGFGVELAIKNMEYKVVDDSKVELSEAERDSEAQAASIGAVRGFLFDTLLTRSTGNATAEKELLEFRDKLEKQENEKSSSSAGGSSQLRAWELDSMGLQATQRILDARNPLGVMQDISASFPALAGSLSKMKVSPQVKREVNKLQKTFGNVFEAPELFVNGLRLDDDASHLYALLKLFRMETENTGNLARLSNITSREASMIIKRARPELASEKVSHGEEVSTSETAREVFSPISRICSIIPIPSIGGQRGNKRVVELVQWMNNIERDRMYERYPNHLQALFPMNYFGYQMETGKLVPQYRKNLFHVVAFLDVNNPLSGAVCVAMKEVLNTGEAVRLGLVVYSKDDVIASSAAGSAGKLTPAQKVARGFHLLNRAVGVSAACNMLTDVGEKRAKKEEVSQVMKKYIKKYGKKHDLKSLFEELMSSETLDYSSLKKDLKRAVDFSSRSAKLADETGFASIDEQEATVGHETGIAVTVNGMFISDALSLLSGLDSALSLSEGSTGDIPGKIYRNLGAFSENFMRFMEGSLKGEVERARNLYIEEKIPQRAQALEHLLDSQSCLPRFNLELVNAFLLRVDLELESGGKYSPVDFSNGDAQSHKALFSPKHRWLNVRDEAQQTDSSSVYMALVGDGLPGWTAFCAATYHLHSKGSSVKEKSSASDLNSLVSFVPNPRAGKASGLHAFIDTFTSSFPGKQSVDIFHKVCLQVEGKGFSGSQLNEELVKEKGLLWSANLALQSEKDGSAVDLADVLDKIKAYKQEGNGIVSIPESLGLSAGESAIVSSNLVVSVKQERADVLAKDFVLLDVLFAKALYGQAISDAFEDRHPDAPTLLSASSFLANTLSKQTKPSIVIADDPRTSSVASTVNEISYTCSKTCVTMSMSPTEGEGQKDGSGSGGDGYIDIVLVIDPLSKFAQKMSPLLSFLKHTFSGSLTLILWPRFGFEDLPIKTYYAYSVPQWPAEEEKGEGDEVWPNSLEARFTSLPATTTLSTQLDTPEAWLTGATAASLDLDNLKLEDLGPSASTMYAEFEIESLIVSGSCIDQSAVEMWRFKEAHPSGLRLMMKGGGGGSNRYFVDTMVMNNLGYFQLKALPGRFNLGLVPGCSSSMFHFAGGKPSSEKGITVSSFEGILDLKLEVERVDPTNADVMKCEKDFNSASSSDSGDEKEEQEKKKTGWLSKLWSARGGGLKRSKTNTLNVFSVASGHLYERFLRIMILSVIKNTKSPVKFWFIKNYMSPKFKRILPVMAKAYGFEFELITYKWPSWVLRQTEKQRIIWAYKILFLDVIFPMSLDRVIYVDADQIVRSDLMELQNMNMHGKVYGFTPFCDEPKDMDGYRFWKQRGGFWESHLKQGGRNLKYHISALYLVDLEAFRALGAGDELRAIYNGLARDPNSLANLDQDLPNYSQTIIPIHSLPQEWLYCETWCGKKGKAKAKTIDLCNNPATKEPKLQAAKRIVKEWEDLDREQEQHCSIPNEEQEVEEELKSEL